ncbi:hypothetical protein TD95_003056 [Thielaviopsis punctulata]|uniref:Uncharacterized protein n=1 Tax=Thielaviopsis punctulata TaxID=72032 RepID=A0A0F4ZHS7_9PEZI|nr:hypothetical protein TD95_003056 [Thielaviopsis punctulata]
MESTHAGGLRAQGADNNALFLAFDSYPWAEDPKFAVLVKGMESRGVSIATTAGLLAARVAFAAKFLKLSINKTDYMEWVQNHGSGYVQPEHKLVGLFSGASDKADPGVGEAEKAPEPAPAPVLGWQAAAPKVDLVVDAKQQSGSGQPPAKFAELLQCMQKGLPVPGVREIPSTVVRDASIKPFGTRAVPKKPWERDAAVATADGGLGAIDQEFPPLNAD